MSIKDFFSSFLNVIEMTLKYPEQIFRESATKLESIIYFVLLSFISSLANVFVLSIFTKSLSSSILSFFTTNFSLGVFTIILTSIAFVIIQLLWFLVESIIFYISFRFVGVKSLSDIMFVIAIAATPVLLLSWIPIIGSIIGLVWSVVLFLFGLKEKCNLRINSMVKGLIISYIVHLIFVLVVLFALVGSVFAFFKDFSAISMKNTYNGISGYNQGIIDSSTGGSSGMISVTDTNPLEKLYVYDYCNQSYLTIYINNFWGPDLDGLNVFLYDEYGNLISTKTIDHLLEDETATLEFFVYNTSDKNFRVVLSDNSHKEVSHDISCSLY